MPLFKHRSLIALPLAGAALLLFAGCHSDGQEATLRTQVNELSLKVDSLVDALEMQRENDSVNIDETSVVLLPGDSSAYVKTEVGYLTARVDSFRDFGNGSRVNFRFGNPGSVTLRGMRAQLEWKVVNERGDTEIQAPVRYEFREDLQPGVLAKINVVLEDLPANRVVGVRISRIRFQQIAFRTDDNSGTMPVERAQKVGRVQTRETALVFRR